MARNLRRIFAGVASSLQLDECRTLGPAIEALTSETCFDIAQFEYWYLGAYRPFARCPVRALPRRSSTA